MEVEGSGFAVWGLWNLGVFTGVGDAFLDPTGA